MKFLLLAVAVAAALVHHGDAHRTDKEIAAYNKAHPKEVIATSARPPLACSFATVPNNFSVTFKNKGLVSDLINLLNDAPMRGTDRAVMSAAVFGEMNTAVTAWCAAHPAKR